MGWVFSRRKASLARRVFKTKTATKNIRQEVLRRVAGAYHNGVLRTIMIRQPNELSKSRFVYNNYFYPIGPSKRILETQGVDGRPIKVDLKGVEYPKSNRGRRRALFAQGLCGRILQKQRFSRGIRGVDNIKDTRQTGIFYDSNIFDKKNSQKYYWE